VRIGVILGDVIKAKSVNDSVCGVVLAGVWHGVVRVAFACLHHVALKVVEAVCHETT
jgi:hypothetical protein